MPTVELLRQQLDFLGQPSHGNKKALKDRLRKFTKKNPESVAVLSAAKLQGDDAASDHDEEGQAPNEGHSTHEKDKDQDVVPLLHQEQEQEQQQQQPQQKQRQQEQKLKLQEREQAQRREVVEKINEEKQRYEERRERELALKREREERRKQALEKRQEREQRLEQEQKAKREQEVKHAAQESEHKNGAKPEPEQSEEQEPTEAISGQVPTTQEVEQESEWKQVSRHALHKNSRYDYYLCFDVEATCEEGFSFEFPNEVIEFPVVLLDGATLEVVDEFHSYVKPVYRPTLSKFCTGLTGITQETIDAAPTFTEVLVLFQDWLKGHGIILGEGGNKKTKTKSKHRSGGGHHHHNNNNHRDSPIHHSVPSAANDFIYGASFCFVTDGPFDIRDFIGKQCLHSQIPRPSYFAQAYLDVRTLFRDYFNLIQWCNLEGMLNFLGETFTGRQHSGICDTRMVALILKRLAEGFSKEENHPIFADTNKPLVAPQWGNGKFDKLKQGCALKANRSTDHTYVKMISFSKLEQIEARMAAAVTAAAPAEAKGAKGSSAKGADGKVDTKKDGFDKDTKKDGFVRDAEGSDTAAGSKGTDKKGAGGKDKGGGKGTSGKGTGGGAKDNAVPDTKAADGKNTSVKTTTAKEADTAAAAASTSASAKDTPPTSAASTGLRLVSNLLLSAFSPSKSKKKKSGRIPPDIKADTLPATLSTPPDSPLVPLDSHSLSSSSSSSATSPTEPFVSSSPYAALMLDQVD